MPPPQSGNGIAATLLQDNFAVIHRSGVLLNGHVLYLRRSTKKYMKSPTSVARALVDLGYCCLEKLNPLKFQVGELVKKEKVFKKLTNPQEREAFMTICLAVFTLPNERPPSKSLPREPSLSPRSSPPSCHSIPNEDSTRTKMPHVP